MRQTEKIGKLRHDVLGPSQVFYHGWSLRCKVKNRAEPEQVDRMKTVFHVQEMDFIPKVVVSQQRM